MSTIAAQTKNDFYEDLSNRVELEDFTNSSILEFLNKERQCNYDPDEAASDIDVESIFEEINRLSDNTDERSVDEILREAEILIGKQPLIGFGSNGNSCKNYVDIESLINETNRELNSVDKKNKINEFRKIVDVVEPDSIISNESIPQGLENNTINDDNDSDDTTNTIEEVLEGIDTINLTVKENHQITEDINPNCYQLYDDNDDDHDHDDDNHDNHKLNDNRNCILSPLSHDQNLKCSSMPVEIEQLDETKEFENVKENEQILIRNSTPPLQRNIDNNNKLKNASTTSLPVLHSPPSNAKFQKQYHLNKTYSRPNSTQSIYNDKNQMASSISSATSMVSIKTPPIDQISVSREHALKYEIDQLQEKLKDTEERLHSLRLQHDSLSQIHRDLRDNHGHVQDESEILKLDVQHLTECAKVLRNELKSAKKDRIEALDVLKKLQSESDDNEIVKKKLQEKNEKDTKIIQDLQRQCKEMERILMRKHPDSVSALIVASKNPGNRIDDGLASRRLLEQRIAQLEADAKDQDIKAQKLLANVQDRFYSVQSKYETHIADLETQVLSLQEINAKLNEKIEFQIVSLNNFTKSNNNYQSSCTQTHDIAERETKTIAIGTQTDLSRPNSVGKQLSNGTSTTTNGASKKSVKNQLHSETSAHHAAAKEDAHLLATIRGMRVDLAIKDKALQRLTRELDECKKTIKKLKKEKDGMKSDKQSSSLIARKSYDPLHYFEQAVENQTIREYVNKIKLLEFDYKALHEKRLQDLKTLQAAHDRELSSCHETVQILQQRLTERDEAFANQKRRKVPIDYYALKAKVTSLERRHSEREKRLHMLVDALSKGHLNGALEEILNDNDQ